ncbi:hypothetical protein GJ744_001020 [Endocarpon pusillum]|uniref:Dynactin subunit 5 n=1 Tax=Endocarpon pusillum TaxID=364733 RepID=A0A8H7E0W9_9EURO|nr:hypothetical protein GJ744_001020 [Endocarpon pusillum]
MPPKSARSGEYIETDNGNKISRRAQLHATQHIILAGKSVIQHDVIIRGDLVRQPPSTTQQTSSSSKPALDPSTGKPKPTPTAQPQTVSIHLGRYVFISPGCTLHPPSRLTTTTTTPTATSNISSTTRANANANAALTSSSSSDLATRRLAAQAQPLSPLSTTVPVLPQPTATATTLLPSTLPSPHLLQTLTYYPLRISSHVYLGPDTYCAAAQIGSHVYIGARCTVGNMVIVKDGVRSRTTRCCRPTRCGGGVVVAGRPAGGWQGRRGWVNGGEREGILGRGRRRRAGRV